MCVCWRCECSFWDFYRVVVVVSFVSRGFLFLFSVCSIVVVCVLVMCIMYLCFNVFNFFNVCVNVLFVLSSFANAFCIVVASFNSLFFKIN